MMNEDTARAIGTQADPWEIQYDHITAEALFAAVDGFDEDGICEFQKDIQNYCKTHHASKMLLGVLAVASGQRLPKSSSAIAFKLQSNVVGFRFIN